MSEADQVLELSIVVPLFNEAGSLPTLCERLVSVLARAPDPIRSAYEIILIDDGSTDDGAAVYEGLRRRHSQIRTIRFRRNFGKTAALQAGFSFSRGHRIVTIDADLQEDPADMLDLLAPLERGYDLVSGWRVARRDPWTKRFPSRVFNSVVRALTGVTLHDINCGYKAYRRTLIEDISLTGDMHRFIPILAQQRGFRMTEIPVRHRERQHGHSKFGASRLWAGYLDFFEVLYLVTFAHRPFRLFGFVGSVFGLTGLLSLVYLVGLWLLQEGPIGNRPLLLFGILGILAGFQFISIGLLGTMLRDSTRGPTTPYSIDAIRCSPIAESKIPASHNGKTSE